MAPVSSKEFLDIQANVECGFSLKRVRNMIKTQLNFLLDVTFSDRIEMITPRILVNLISLVSVNAVL